MIPRKQPDLTTGRITPTILRLAWPVVASMFLETAFHVANAFWMGLFSAEAMASVITSGFIIWLVFSLFGVVGTGTNAMIARFIGARDEPMAAKVAGQALLFGTTFSLGIALLGIGIRPHIFRLMGTAPEVTSYGMTYLLIIFAAVPLFAACEVFASMFRACGDTKTPLISFGLGTGLNMVLDPLLIFGVGPFPKLAVAGAGIATLANALLSLALLLWFLKRKPVPFKPTWRYDFGLIWRIARIGIPASISGILFSIVYVFLTRITSAFGTEALAALGIGNRIESINYMASFGFEMATATMVGQNLGAKKTERSEKSAWRAAQIIVGVTGVTSIVMFVFSRQIASWFTPDPKVIPLAASYARIIAFSQIFMGLEIVFSGGFSGAGDTLPPLIITGPLSLLRLPVALVLASVFHLRSDAVWWAISSTSIAKGILMALWFKAGRWKKKEV